MIDGKVAPAQDGCVTKQRTIMRLQDYPQLPHTIHKDVSKSSVCDLILGISVALNVLLPPLSMARLKTCQPPAWMYEVQIS